MAPPQICSLLILWISVVKPFPKGSWNNFKRIKILKTTFFFFFQQRQFCNMCLITGLKLSLAGLLWTAAAGGFLWWDPALSAHFGCTLAPASVVWTEQLQMHLEKGQTLQEWQVSPWGDVESFLKEVSSKTILARGKVTKRNLDPLKIIVIIFGAFHVFRMMEDNFLAFTTAGGPGFTGFSRKAISKHWTQFMSDCNGQYCENNSAWDYKKLGEKFGTLGQTIARIEVQ